MTIGRKRADGFTLVELMIVMAIIVILAGMATALYVNSIQRSKEAVLKTDLFRMRDAIDQYYADKNKYPASLDALVSEKYLRTVPVDPMTNSTDTWQTTMSDSLTLARSIFRSRTRSSASATVLFIFQLPAMMSLRSFIRKWVVKI